MNNAVYKEDDNTLEICYKAFWDKKEIINISLGQSSLIVSKNGKETTIKVSEATEVIFTVNQNSPPKNAYSDIFVVTGEVYFKTTDEPIELATFMNFEPKDLLLRDTQGFKMAEAIASKLGTYYNLSSKYQYEILTKKKQQGLYWVGGLILMMWAAVFLLIFLAVRK